MKNSSEIEILENQKQQVKENSEVSYWSKKYDVSAEDLKNGKQNSGILDKLVESFLQKAR